MTLRDIPAGDTTEYDADLSPLARKPAASQDEQQLPTINSPENDVINTALKTAVEKFPTINDMLVHEGGTIWFKSAKHTQRIGQMFKTAGTPYERSITGKDISFFVIVRVMGATTQEQANTIWKRIQEEIRTRGSFSDSIKLGWGSNARVQLFRQGKGRWALNVRVSRSIPPTLDQIGLPQQVIPLLRGAQRGLILLTGPMSSGKTTAAQALLNHHNITRSGHIVTIEDPIETDLKSGMCLISAKEVGVDCVSFHQGLIDALRQAVNLLFIGELRDAETIRTALAAAASGILVIATTHGDTCTGTLSKIMTLLGSDAPGYYKLISQNLVCVIRHAMVPSKNGDAWISVGDALMPMEGGQMASWIGEGKISSIEQFISQPQSMRSGQPQAPEWVSMNDRLVQLVRSDQITMAMARQTSSNPRGLTT